MTERTGKHEPAISTPYTASLAPRQVSTTGAYLPMSPHYEDPEPLIGARSGTQPFAATRSMSWHSVIGRAVDLFIAATALLVLALPLLLIAILVRTTSSGPVLFRQDRVGLGGRTFTMLKFRTMRTGVGDEMLRKLVEAELRGENTSVDGSYKLAADPRVTRIGAILRKTSLDELPQLFNVLAGSMALVGPRPCLEWEARLFPVDFQPRFRVRPGLTGLWQVSGRSTMGTLDMLHLDLTYVRTRTLTGDLSILLRTIPSMLRDQSSR